LAERELNTILATGGGTRGVAERAAWADHDAATTRCTTLTPMPMPSWRALFGNRFALFVDRATFISCKTDDVVNCRPRWLLGFRPSSQPDAK
jgi:hypothetical protein